MMVTPILQCRSQPTDPRIPAYNPQDVQVEVCREPPRTATPGTHAATCPITNLTYTAPLSYTAPVPTSKQGRVTLLRDRSFLRPVHLATQTQRSRGSATLPMLRMDVCGCSCGPR
jgi:hypothetical protein